MATDPLQHRLESRLIKWGAALLERWHKLIEPPASLPFGTLSRARLLSYLLLLQIFVLTFVIPIAVSSPEFMKSAEPLVFLGVLLLLILAYGLSRTKHYQPAALLTVAVTAVGAWGFSLTGHVYPNDIIQNLVYILVSVVLCSVLLSVRTTILLSAFHVMGLALLTEFYPHLKESPQLVNLFIFVGLTSVLTVVGAALRHRDQEERQQKSFALAESEAQLQSILDNSTAIVYLKDAQGRYLLVNRQYEEVLKVNRAQVIGRTAIEIFPKEMADAFWSKDLLVLQAGESMKVEETTTDEQGVHTFLSVKFPVRDSGGKISAVGNISTEITDRKQIEEALRQSEERLRLVSYATNDAVWDWDLISGERKWNQSIQRIFGYDSDQVESDTSWWEERIHPEDQEKITGSIRMTINNCEEFWSREYRFRSADDTYAYVFDRGYIIYDNGKPIRMLGAMMDITERKRIEDALIEERNYLHMLLDNLPDAIYFKDPKSRFIRINQTHARWFGLSDPVQAVGKTDFDFFPEKYARSYYEDEQAIMQSGKPLVGKEENQTLPNGQVGWVSSTKMPLRNQKGQIIGTFGVSRDITERKQVENALIAERNLLHTLMDNIPDWIYFKDSESRFISVNNAFAARHHLNSPQELIGKTDFDIFAEEHARPAFEDEQRIMKTGKPLLYKEEKEVKPDGSIRWVSTTKLPMRDSLGQIVGTFGISYDITERRKVEEDLQLANQKLTAWVGELEQHSREANLLNEMSDLLQACSAAEEAYAVIAEQTRKLFPDEAGVLYIISASRNLVEKVAAWGPPLPDPPMFKPGDCWGLRRGRLHVVERNIAGISHPGDIPALLCHHLQPPGPPAYICMPLAAQGEALGVLHMRQLTQMGTGKTTAGSCEWYTEAKQQLARTVADSLSLALANLNLRETLRQQSIRDPLTGLFNRRYLEESLDREMRRVIRAQRPLGVIMVDIDHFKNFNDSYGHDTGDALLRELGTLLRSQIRGEDIPCRYGGEEFALIMPDAPMEVTRQRAENLREGIKRLNVQHYGQAVGSVTVSCGVACFPDHGNTGNDIIRAADAALYRAKKAGRDRTVVASTTKKLKKSTVR